MPRTSSRPKQQPINLRVDSELKAEFNKTAKAHKMDSAEVLRGLMRDYVAAARRSPLRSHTPSQSPADPRKEAEVVQWIENATAIE